MGAVGYPLTMLTGVDHTFSTGPNKRVWVDTPSQPHHLSLFVDLGCNCERAVLQRGRGQERDRQKAGS